MTEDEKKDGKITNRPVQAVGLSESEVEDLSLDDLISSDVIESLRDTATKLEAYDPLAVDPVADRVLAIQLRNYLKDIDKDKSR
jgi:hypothetical protein